MAASPSTSQELAERRFAASTTKLIQQQGDSVIQGFTIVIKKYDPHHSSEQQDTVHYPKHLEELTAETTASKKEFYTSLLDLVLPLLKQQITSLSSLLDPIHLWNEPNFTYELILSIQS
ncbi:hypothetical protein MJO28_015753 [Puccinia striiformis f. sp. tritici]|uniref:Uncharacterized protein n=3 Tax=Puccinia striiformis TaxID=27350 RepID=A0A0L0UUC7_9BASI|nr:hypothetical protein Pst134EA_029274 [Puccinia striiformis f. sp. tritici]KAI9614227.1 hypothetical protein H4Q26_009368 [Puccinia striiformis f. sp. tritici PST-130]KNE90359.1 hypothetical protein PSTG_16182 [Puccinia striiformis f. sp. tritici PST-78]POW16620.1 hypothetical protein PSTT_01098 [Puccinia striiformis]KAH9441268.1 hypothetical protein Pst134EB_029932 [Puccinia striiformis f. sp. tritici]KAH9447241.1 hypothetical protein Pst134EA_029274 [Puccinia striiformis f. sp. tritici]